MIMVGSTMRIPLLYRGEYSQWHERFMNYLEEQTDGEAMINSIQNGDQPLPVVAQVSLAGTAQLASPTLKDLKFWTAEEKKTRKIDRLQNQGDVNDALRYKKKAIMVTSDPLALVAEKTKVSKCKEKVKVQLESEESDDEDIIEKEQDKRADEKKRDMSKVKCYNCKKEGHFSKDCKKAKEIIVNMVFMAQIEKVLSNSDESSSFAEETIAETIHMIMPSKDTLCNGRKGIGFENPSYFEKAKDLRPSLYDEKAIGLGYTPMFLIRSDEALEIENFKSARENKIKFAYDYGNLNASYVNDKINFSDDYFQEIINPNFEKIDSPFQQTSSLKLYVPTVILEKIKIDLEDEVVSLLEKEKANLKTIESLKSKGFDSSENAISESENQSEYDCQVVEKECDNVENPKVIAPGMFKLNLDTFSSVRKPKQSSVIWKKKGSSNTSNVDLSSISHSKSNKDVKRYSCKDLLCDSFDENNLFIFDDESVRISPVSKMPFRKKPRDSLNVFGTVRFGNNDFAVIAGYGVVVIELMTIKKVYHVE
nr:hypothetical protein [Tanacetum cinerariifolium]